MDFHSVWLAFEAVTGDIEGIYEQTIYGKTLAEAVAAFTTMHGELSVDTSGIAHEITSISLA